MQPAGVDGNALTSAGLVQDPVETLRRRASLADATPVIKLISGVGWAKSAAQPHRASLARDFAHASMHVQRVGNGAPDLRACGGRVFAPFAHPTPLMSGRRLCRANSNQSEQFRSDLGILGGHYAGLSPALFRCRDVRGFRAARGLRITWPHGLRASQCHCDKSGREDRPHDGIGFEPSIECALILRGQPPIVRSYAAFSHVTPLRLVCHCKEMVRE